MPQNQSEQVNEKTVIEGLSKKLLKDRKKYLRKAVQVPTEGVFSKLASMYLVPNEIRVYVFQAMKDINYLAAGRFSAQLGAAMQQEYTRLKSLSSNTDSYLKECLWQCIMHPHPGFDDYVNFVIGIAEAADSYFSSDAARKELAATCYLYFAIRDKPGFMERVGNSYMKSEFMDGNMVVELFSKRKNSMLVKHLASILLAEPRTPGWTSLALDYVAYMEALGSPADPDIVKRLSAECELESKETEHIIDSIYGNSKK